METLIILIKLLCAHLCSDFILQTDRINSWKRKPSLKGISYLILHSITHACIAYMLVANWSCWQIPAIVFISHFIIDLVKCKCCKESLSTFIFVISLYCIDLWIKTRHSRGQTVHRRRHRPLAPSARFPSRRLPLRCAALHPAPDVPQRHHPRPPRLRRQGMPVLRRHEGVWGAEVRTLLFIQEAMQLRHSLLSCVVHPPLSLKSRKACHETHEGHEGH